MAKTNSAAIELAHFDSAGKKLGSKEADASLFAADVSTSILHDVVRWQRAKARSGTHTVKTRAEVKATGAKPWRQKGTGRARAGSFASPIWVGGGVAHGPKQRSYEFSLNGKLRKKALCSALTARASDEKCLVLKDFGLDKPKSQQAAAVLESIGVPRGRKALVVLGSDDEVSKKSLRNLPGISVLETDGLNVYAVLNSEFLIFTEAGLEGVQARLGA